MFEYHTSLDIIYLGLLHIFYHRKHIFHLLTPIVIQDYDKQHQAQMSGNRELRRKHGVIWFINGEMLYSGCGGRPEIPKTAS